MNTLPLTHVSQDSVPDCMDNVNEIDIFNRQYYAYDRSLLNDIDPDTNYLNDASNNISSNYYNENSFNTKFKNNTNLSFIHLNIRSVPLHFSELLCYLDTLLINFKIIALSETSINMNHTTYNIPSYNLEMNYREKRKGGGVSLYIHDSIQYKSRTDLEIGGDVNSVFIEILKSSSNTKNNVICIYISINISINVSEII